MSAGEYCNREIVVVEKSDSVREAAKLMRERHVGDVVVVEKTAEGAKPQGILTDRDIVIELLAKDVDVDSVSIGDIMSTHLVSVNEDTKLLDAINLMRDKSIRRLIVLTETGTLAGLLSVDDILEIVTEQLTSLSKLIANEIENEQQHRS